MIDHHTVEHRLRDLGVELPNNCVPRARFLPWRRSNGLLFLSGQVNEREGVIRRSGLVGVDLTVEEARAEAEVCVLNLLFHLRAALGGSLAEPVTWLRLGGFVAAPPGFAEAPRVIDAASDLLMQLYGERGAHARTAIAVAGLPGGACVEIDAVVALEG